MAPNGLHLPHARLRQHPPHPRPRWRPRALPPLRSCHAAQAEREIHGTRPDAGHDSPARAHGLRHLQRLPEIHLLRGIKIENHKKPEKKQHPRFKPSPHRVARLEAGERKTNPVRTFKMHTARRQAFVSPLKNLIKKLPCFSRSKRAFSLLLRFIYCLLSHLQIATYGAYRSENIAPHIKSYAFWRTPSQMRPYLLLDAFVSGSRRVRDCSQMRSCLDPRSLTNKGIHDFLQSRWLLCKS